MRKEWIDSLKGILIFLVVLGHVVGMAAHLSSGFEREVYSYIYKFIYLFHMPAFFFVAGLVWKRKDIGFGAFVWNKFKRLMIPYYIWGVLSILVFQLGMGMMAGVRESAGYYRDAMFDKTIWQSFLSLLHAGGWPNGEGFRYNSVLWFLPCMFTVQVMYRVVEKFCTSKKSLLIVAIGAIVIDGAFRVYNVPGLPMGISIAFKYLGFMILGSIGKDFISQDIGYKYVGGVLLVYLLLTWLFPSNLVVLHQEWGWYVLWSMTSLVGSIGAALFVMTTIPISYIFKEMGLNSLTIMLIHKFIVVAIMAIGTRFLPNGVYLAVIIATVMSISTSIWVAKLLRKCCPMMIGEKAKRGDEK